METNTIHFTLDGLSFISEFNNFPIFSNSISTNSRIFTKFAFQMRTLDGSSGLLFTNHRHRNIFYPSTLFVEMFAELSEEERWLL